METLESMQQMPSLRDYRADTTTFKLTLPGLAATDFVLLDFDVQNYAISESYTLACSIESKHTLNPAELVGKPASLSMSWSGGDAVYLHGVVSELTYKKNRVDGEEYIVEIASPLFALTKRRNNRVFVNQDVLTIVRDVLIDAGFAASDFSINTKATYPQREFTVQYDESDFEFLQRRLAHDGLFYWFEQTEQGAKLIIVDAIDEAQPMAGGGELSYQVQKGTTRDVETVFAVYRHAQLLTDNVRVKEYNDCTPEAALNIATSCNAQVVGVGNNYQYIENYKTLDEGDRIAKIRQQALDWQRETFMMHSDCRGLAPGMRFTLSGHPDDAQNGEYTVVSIYIEGNQRAAQARGESKGAMTYQNRLHVIRSGVPYRATLPPTRYIDGVVNAVVETTGGEYAYLDELGRYHIRMGFDLGSNAPAQASLPVRLMTPHTGRDYGWHFPLHAGAETVVSFINGDVDRPIMLGAVYHPGSTNVVSAQNASQNILRSWGENELCMEDKQQDECIDLFTAQQKNILRLHAKDGDHLFRLASMEGEMEHYAAKTMLMESGDTHTLQSGNDHLITVENAAHLSTKNKQIEYKAGTDIRFKAGDHIAWHAQTQNIDMNAQKDFVIDVTQAMSVEVRNANVSMDMSAGNLNISAAKAITLTGQAGGAITIGQSSGKVVVNTDGSIQITGSTVNVNGNSINIKGQSMKQGGGGSGSGANAASVAGTDKLNLDPMGLINVIAQGVISLFGGITGISSGNVGAGNVAVGAVTGGAQSLEGAATTNANPAAGTSATTTQQNADKQEECLKQDSPDLKKKRLERYYGTSDESKIKSLARDKLGLTNAVIPSSKEKKENWKKFVEKCFPKEPKVKDEYTAEVQYYGPKLGTKAYTKWQEYAQTDYGALMIKKVLEDKSGKPFAVKVVNGVRAQGESDFITVPEDFPASTTYEFGGQEVDPLAVLHHEFEHTRFGKYEGSDKDSLVDEVAAVVHSENPVRILNGKEPRYTYTKIDTEGNPVVTVSVLVPDNRKDGGWSFCKNDPTRLTQ